MIQRVVFFILLCLIWFPLVNFLLDMYDRTCYFIIEKMLKSKSSFVQELLSKILGV